VAAFLGPGVSIFDRALTWSEVIWGMLRMQLLSDFLRQLLRNRLIDENKYEEVHLEGNISINSGQPDPFGVTISRLEGLGLTRAEIMANLELAVANSSVISYLQIGRPETILIDRRERIEHQLAVLADRGEPDEVVA
jgi:hypothetical protein